MKIINTILLPLHLVTFLIYISFWLVVYIIDAIAEWMKQSIFDAKCKFGDLYK